MAEGEEPQAVPARRRRKGAAIIEGRRKEPTIRGATLAQIQAMPFEEQIKLMPARARRTLRRGFSYEQNKLLEDIRDTAPGTTIKTHRREMLILPEFVGHIFSVHAGKEFKTFTVQPEMIGHYLGEFALTRKGVKHTGVGVGATRGSKHLPLK